LIIEKYRIYFVSRISKNNVMTISESTYKPSSVPLDPPAGGRESVVISLDPTSRLDSSNLPAPNKGLWNKNIHILLCSFAYLLRFKRIK